MRFRVQWILIPPQGKDFAEPKTQVVADDQNQSLVRGQLGTHPQVFIMFEEAFADVAALVELRDLSDYSDSGGRASRPRMNARRNDARYRLMEPFERPAIASR